MSRANFQLPSPFSTSPEYPAAQPFVGAVDNTVEAFHLVYASCLGVIPRVLRRLNDGERKQLVGSGAVFVFSVQESQIKRWTDGKVWSPSRIDGNFLVYKEMNEKNGGPTTSDRFEEWKPEDGKLRPPRSSSGVSSSSPGGNKNSKASAAMLDGGYKFGGLVKKTITVTLEGLDHHLIFYYLPADIDNGRLRPLTSRPDIMGLSLPVDNFTFKDFRLPPRIEVGTDGVRRIVCEQDTMSDNTPEVTLPARPTLNITTASSRTPSLRTHALRVVREESPAMSPPRWPTSSSPGESTSSTHLSVIAVQHRVSTSPIQSTSAYAAYSIPSPSTPSHANETWRPEQEYNSHPSSGSISPFLPQPWSSLPLYPYEEVSHESVTPPHPHSSTHYSPDLISSSSSSMGEYTSGNQHGSMWMSSAGRDSSSSGNSWPGYKMPQGNPSDWLSHHQTGSMQADSAPENQQQPPHTPTYGSTQDSTQEWTTSQMTATEYHASVGETYYMAFGQSGQYQDDKNGERGAH